jgi:TPR repeat protein
MTTQYLATLRILCVSALVLPILFLGTYQKASANNVKAQNQYTNALRAKNSGKYLAAYTLVKPLAETNLYSFSPSAKHLLASLYEKGLGIPKNINKAIHFYKKSFETAISNATKANSAFSLGFLYYEGVDVKKDPLEAAKWLQYSVDFGGSGTQTLKYLLSRPEVYVHLNKKQFSSEVSNLDKSELKNIKTLYAQKKYDEVFRLVNKHALGGNVEAQEALAQLYWNGQGVKQSRGQASRWWFLAAENGLAHSQQQLGSLYLEGGIVPIDRETGMNWLRRAADQGYAASQNDLAIQLIYPPPGVEPKISEAIELFISSANQGFDLAQYNLGDLLSEGKYIDKDLPRAIDFYRHASAQGHDDATKKLAKLDPSILKEKVPEPKKTQTEKAKVVPRIKTEPEIATTVPKQRFPTSYVQVKHFKGTPNADDVAIIIGNANYKKLGKDIPNVTPAYADAEGMKNYVTQALGIAEDNIIYLKDATQKDLVATFGNETNHKGRLYRYLAGGKSKVFVFYSGHGAPGDQSTNYLVPSDAEASLIDLNGYSLKTLYQNLSKLPAKSVTVVLEACFSGASEAGTVITNASPVYLKAKDTGIPSNITVIAAGAANQIASWETDKSHGLFTKYFLKGMSGDADNNNDRKVSWDELKDYFARTVTRSAMRNYGREQTPQIVVGTGG